MHLAPRRARVRLARRLGPGLAVSRVGRAQRQEGSARGRRPPGCRPALPRRSAALLGGRRGNGGPWGGRLGGRQAGERQAGERTAGGRQTAGRNAEGRQAGERRAGGADGRGTAGRGTADRGAERRGTAGRGTADRGAERRGTADRGAERRGTADRGADGRGADGRGGQGAASEGRGRGFGAAAGSRRALIQVGLIGGAGVAAVPLIGLLGRKARASKPAPGYVTLSLNANWLFGGQYTAGRRARPSTTAASRRSRCRTPSPRFPGATGIPARGSRSGSTGVISAASGCWARAARGRGSSPTSTGS